MKTPLILAAAGSLSVMAMPAHAAAIETAPSTFAAHAPDFTPAMLAQGARYGDDDRWDDDRWEDRRWRDRRGRRHYDDRARYEERRNGHRDRIWRGRDGRYYCERGDGTTGLLVGAGVGALLGRTIDTRGDRTVGTLLGGALGAVLGREIDRGDVRCR
jgi:hypothetical protein